LSIIPKKFSLIQHLIQHILLPGTIQSNVSRPGLFIDHDKRSLAFLNIRVKRKCRRAQEVTPISESTVTRYIPQSDGLLPGRLPLKTLLHQCLRHFPPRYCVISLVQKRPSVSFWRTCTRWFISWMRAVSGGFWSGVAAFGICRKVRSNSSMTGWLSTGSESFWWHVTTRSSLKGKVGLARRNS